MLVCKCCNASYEKGTYNFYNLCNPCFNQFDNKKMEARFAPLTGLKYDVATRGNSEDSDAFVRGGECTHTEDINLIQSFISALSNSAE